MTKDDIKRMALEAGLIGGPVYTRGLERFAALVAAAERDGLSRTRRAQVSPLQFATMVFEKEDVIGNPIVWAEWPNKEKNT
jgi:hypothetical protein